jgi:hypothetical protein
MELPEETRASAAAMRRVVAEQIEALSELNAIVRAQPATHDLNEGRRSPPPSPRREEPAPRREEPVREAPRAETPRPEPIRAAEPAPRPEPVRPAVAPRAAPVAAAPAAATLAPARPVVAPVAPVTAAAPKAAEEGGGGWLRDVLRNASATAAAPAAAPIAPAPAPTPQPAPEKNLTSLTDEIAKAMDHNALADAWGRYQRGEQNVFSRRIYSLTGQGTYDEVRKRLQRDNDFAATAATYMSEFEQLLQTATQSPNPGAAASEFLLSDRGRVYTMLAHASGRLG